MCAQRYEPHVPRWVQQLQVEMLELQMKPETTTEEELEDQRKRREVLDREILDMVDNKLYMCWICLQQDDFTKLLTPCKCEGFLKHCHRKCLDEWVKKHDKLSEENTQMRKWGTTCNHCGEPYSLKPATGPLMLKMKDKLFGTDATSRGLQIGESFEGTKLPLLDKWKELVWSRFSLMHPVLNIAYMPPQDPYTRPMRCTVLLCTVFGGLVSSALIYGKSPPATIPDKIVAVVFGSAIMSITPAIFIMMFIVGTGSNAVANPKQPAPPRPSMERETAYQRQVRAAHEARMSKMNPIQKALYLMKNPAAKPPPDPEPPKK